MKCILSLLAFGIVPAAIAAPTLTIDSVRQRWPFSQNVDITFTIANGADGEFYPLRDFSVSDGDRVFEVSPLAFSNVQPAYSNGTYKIVFDPSGTALESVVAVQHFKVAFDICEAPVRYMILDLGKEAGEAGAIEYLYAGDPRLESYVQTIDYMDGEVAKQTTIRYDDAWLTVTNKTYESAGNATTPYALTKMVFRLVKPGVYSVGKGDGSAYNDVTLTKPYFIAVFPLTRGQYGCMRYGDWQQRDGDRDANCRKQDMQQDLYLDDLRGPHGDSTYPVDWIQFGHAVCPTSFIGRARAKYGLAFDMPTETQWEVAARAGTKSYYYDADESRTTANADLLSKIGYVGSADSEWYPHPGEKLANAWGLFDCLGCGQGVLDNIPPAGIGVNDGKWPSGTDPVGEYKDWRGGTFCKGGAHSAGAEKACGLRGGQTSAVPDGTWYGDYYNRVRLVINVN